MINKNSNLGFTLLELLLVVLIIGIFATIALPRYQLGRDKAEFRKYQVMVSSLKDAYYDYFMRKGKGTKNFDDLSVSLPSDFIISKDDNLSYQCRSNDEMFCCMSRYIYQTSAYINCGKKDLSIIYHYPLFSYKGEMSNVKGRGLCFAEIDNKRANRLCKSLGVKGIIYEMEHTPIGYKKYQRYTMK